MTYKEQKAIIEGWLNEDLSQRGDLGQRVRFKLTRDEAGDQGWAGRLIFCTAAHSYSVSFTETYLGCGGSCRTVLAGESWTRGSDLPDGPFCRETWDEILLGVLVYELVPLEPEREPAGTPATAPAPALATSPAPSRVSSEGAGR